MSAARFTAEELQAAAAREEVAVPPLQPPPEIPEEETLRETLDPSAVLRLRSDRAQPGEGGSLPVDQLAVGTALEDLVFDADEGHLELDDGVAEEYAATSTPVLALIRRLPFE